MVNYSKFLLITSIIGINYNVIIAANTNLNKPPLSKLLSVSSNNNVYEENDIDETDIASKLKLQANDPNYKDNNKPAKLDDNKVILNFENSDIQSTIKAISKLSGKNFVIDPKVKGNITIVSDQPIAKVDTYKVLETALRMQGFAVVEGNGVIKVLAENDAKTYGNSIANTHNQKQLGDEIITKVFIIQKGSASQLASSLRPIISSNNAISVYQNSNALIITDYASNISRITQIINQVSVSNQQNIKPIIIQLKYATAADVAQVVQSYLQNGATSGSSGGYSGGGSSGNSDTPTVSITVDALSNSIIVYSAIKEQSLSLRDLILTLDKNNNITNNNLHVVYLRNGDAAHIAEVLRVVAFDQENPDLTATSALSKFANEPSSMFEGNSSGSGSSGSSTASSSGSGSAYKGTSSYNGSSNKNSNNGQNNNAPKILIQAEPNTNSLIIKAPDAIYRNLRMIIDMLDVRRAQVMIEAMIADINSTNTGAFGIQWVVGAGNNNLGGLAAANYGGGGSSLSGIATTAVTANAAVKGGGAGGATAGGGINLPNEVFVGLVTGNVSIGGQQIPSISALADMIAATHSVNILSRPTLITLDNEEAKIMVGSNVPVPNGSYVNTASSNNNMTTTYERKDIGTFLDIKPLITQSGAIQLDVYQEDSQIDTSAQTATTDQSGPSFLKRNIRATLLVDDGQIIAIGGMTRDSIDLQKNGVPVLSSIPYLGWLFSWEKRTHVKQNLVLFLRPVIIRNIEGYAALSNSRYKYIMDQQNTIKADGNIMLPTINPINLDNQVPYDNVILPKQPNKPTTKLPIVDLRPNEAKASNT